MPTVSYNNREQWLSTAMEKMAERYLVKPAHKLPPKVAVSCGIPAGSLRAIGQCWCPSTSSDGTTHIYICPTQDDPVEILHVLLHEMVHAAVGVKEKHGPAFGRLARFLGMEGPLTSTTPSDALRSELEGLSDVLGPYPHSAVSKSKPKKPKDPKPKKIKLLPGGGRFPGYEVWVAEDQLESYGPPLDPSGQPLLTKEQLEDE